MSDEHPRWPVVVRMYDVPNERVEVYYHAGNGNFYCLWDMNSGFREFDFEIEADSKLLTGSTRLEINDPRYDLVIALEACRALSVEPSSTIIEQLKGIDRERAKSSAEVSA